MPRGKLPSGFGKTLKALYAQGYTSKDAMREAWKIHRGSGPGMSRKQQPQKYLSNKKDAQYILHIGKRGKAYLYDHKGNKRYLTKYQVDLAKKEGYKIVDDNPISHKKALVYARELVKHEKAGVKENPNYKYGVFVWAGGTGKYHIDNVIKLFARESDAKKFADKNIVKNYVVRSLNYVQGWRSNPGKRYRHAVTERQRRFMGAELGRRRAGKRTESGMTTKQLREFARKPRKRKRKRKNPIVVYNPALSSRERKVSANPSRSIVTGATPLPIKNVEVRYQRSAGEYHGEWFRHPFKSSVEVIGLPDGSILIRSKSGKKLWGTV